MKKNYKLLILLVLPVLLLSGCFKKETLKDLMYEDVDYKVTFGIKEKYDYKLVMDRDYFRTSREEGMILGNNFRIGIEFNRDLALKNTTFDKYMKKYEKEEDFKKVKYGKMNGFQFYYRTYLRYEIYLQVNDELILRLNIYSLNDNKKATTAALESSEVQDILKHITVVVK